MASLLAEFQPDVVHLHSIHHHLTLAVIDACLDAGLPVVWTLHDYRSVCPATSLLRRGETCERCSGGAFFHGLAGRCKSGEMARSLAAVVESYGVRARGTLAKVDCYIAPSEFLGRKVLDMGLPAKRLEVVPNPVFSEPAREPERQRHDILYVGRLSPEKGLDCVIRAVAGSADVRLHVVGDGPERDRLASLAATLGADVVFDGWLEETAVRTRMCESQLLCVPSVWYENCPGVVLEAMLLGLPVVASDLGALSELLDGGRAGWLVPPGDSDAWRRGIERALLHDTETLARAEVASRRVRARHNPEGYLKRLEAIYASLVS